MERDFWVCRNLYVSTIPHHAPGWAVKYLRRIFAPALRNVANKSKAIYLVRGDVRWRRVKNEEEVIEHLADELLALCGRSTPFAIPPTHQHWQEST